jgi:arylsulfatase A-like enzyme
MIIKTFKLLIIAFIFTIKMNAQKPNIILIIVDDAGYVDWGFQGSTVMETPRLDQLRSEGTFFTHAYVTNSVCAPSRAGLMTGRYQNRFGFEYNIVTYYAAPDHTLEDVGLDPAEKTIADYLKPLGYSTAAIGKWHLGAEDKHHPNNRGFDYFYGLLDGSRPYFHTSDLPAGKKLMRNFTVDDMADGYVTDVLTDNAIGWISQQVNSGDGSPFFTYLSYTAVHGPYESKTEDFDHFSDNCIGFDDNACSTQRQNYAAMTYSLDQNIGKLVDSLKSLGVYDNTLLFFINDNGGPDPKVVTDNGVLRGGKSSCYEGGLRVPLFCVWPGHIPAENTYEKQVISLDILPTILTAAGGAVSPEMKLDGVDLVPVANNVEQKAHDYLYWRKFLVWDVVQKEDQKLIIKFNEPGDWDNDTLLYNLANDISESSNLYNFSNKKSASDLLQKLTSWKEELEYPAWIGEEISNKQCDEGVTDMESCDNIMIAYGKKQAAAGGAIIWTGEAEDGILTGSVELNTTCAFSSGGEFIKLMSDNGNSITFDNVEIPTAGNYQLVVDYFYVGTSSMEILLNDVSLGIYSPESAQWCYQGPPAQFILDIDLPAGTNKLEFRVANGVVGPFLDRIGILDPNTSYQSRAFYLSSSEGDDDNDGLSPNKPFKSLEKISTVALGGGDSILFKTGDTFIGQLFVNGSGTEDSPIIIESYGDGDKPIIDGAKADGGAYLSAVLINNQEYIEIKNLEITNDRKVSRSGVSDDLAYGVYVLNNGNDIMHHILLKHLTIRDIFAVSIDGVEFNSVKVSAICFKSEQNTILGKEKNIQDVLVDSCYITRTTRYGIWTAHGGGAEGVGNDSINRNMNLVFSNNHFYQTGGSCITPGRSYNCLLENNIFDYPGSDADPRMVNRGSGAWFWSCKNVMAQFNKSYHVRGEGDSYGMHIDFGNENVILQYNYSEDSQGGFVEILGKNINSVYRFNVSVNDGFRANGKSLWVSDYAGSGVKILSEDNYIYNNSIYVDASITPDISIVSLNTYVYNNIFYATGAAQIGGEVTVDIDAGSEFISSNNLYFGNVTKLWSNYDSSPVFGDPQFENPGSTDVNGYRINVTSPAFSAGANFQEPSFPNAGKGIFKDVKTYPEFDLYGNQVNVRSGLLSIGAFNANGVSNGVNQSETIKNTKLSIYPNPVKEQLYITYNAKANQDVHIIISDLQGRVVQSKSVKAVYGENKIEFLIDPELRNGIYLLGAVSSGQMEYEMFVLTR